jgi:2,4-dienoyl-CoA reductase-like NADH-dependent reductase (Old Yellow Enzyme family)
MNPQSSESFYPTIVVQAASSAGDGQGVRARGGAELLAGGGADAIVYGVKFLANPDLPERFRRGAQLNEPDQSTFYAPGERGYTDYPTLGQMLEVSNV